MRKRTLAALVSACALVSGVEIAVADTNLFVTQADFGGSQFAPGGKQQISGSTVVTNPNPVPSGEIQQTNWTGMGFYNSSTTGGGGGTIAPSDSLGDTLAYPATSLGGL